MRRMPREWARAFASGDRLVTCRDPRRPLRETPLEDAFGKPVSEHLQRSPRDHPAARAPEAVLDERLARITESAHALQRFICNFEAGPVAEKLGDRRLVSGRKSAVAISRRAVEQELRSVELNFHVREFPLQPLKIAQRTAERPRRPRVSARPA